MKRKLALLLTLLLVLSAATLPAQAKPGGRTAPEPEGIQVTVAFAGESLPADAAAIVEAAGGTVVTALPELGVLYARGPASMLADLNAHTAVLAANPTFVFEAPALQASPLEEASATPGKKQGGKPAAEASVTPDLYQIYQWDIKQVTENGSSFNLSTGSHNTVVGIIDSGISLNHPDLQANNLGGRNYVPDGPNGEVVPDDINDRHGHGSHVAGNIAGKGRILGVGPDLGVRSYRVFGATGGSPSDRIMQAMIEAVNDGVDVISMSLGGFDVIAWGYWTDPETGIVYRFKDVADFVAYKRAVQYAYNNGVVVVAAAGNDAIDISNPATVTAFLNDYYGPYGYSFQGASREVPGSLPHVIAVSATGPDKGLSSYSNYGSGVIDLAAPGGDFQRYPVGDWYLDMCLSAYMGTGYVFMAGTSMATPKVSAVAALVIDQAKANGQALSPSQVTALLQQTAVDEGKVGADPYYGHGFVNAYNALMGN